MKNDSIKQRFHRLCSLRQTVQETWDQIERFIAPYRGRFFKDERSENSIEWRRPFIYDSTAIMASQSLAASLHSSLTSPKIRWFDLKFRNQELQDDQEAVEWLDEVSKQMFKTLQDSNFNVQAGETYQDIVDFGTSIICEEPVSEQEWKGINFSSVPLKQGYFEQDENGNLLNFYRMLEWSPLQIFNKFGDKTPEHIMKKLDDPKQAEVRQKIIFCIFRRLNINPDDINIFKPLAPKNRPYGFKYILEKDASLIGEEGGYFEMPAFVPRWRTTSSSMWGNSPAMIALADVITLNHLVELQIQAMEKVVDPAIVTTERGLMGDLDLNPGGLSVLRDINDLRPFESGARFDINYQEIARYRDQIREYFMIDQLILPPMEGTPASATEIAARISQLERLIGPTLGRLQSDFLDPCIQRTFNIMMRAGIFPEVPQVVAETASGLDIEYVGALARSQEQDQVQSVERWLMQLMQVAQVSPDALDVVDWDAIGRGTAQMLGVPAKFLKSKDEAAQTREDRKDAERAMIEAERARAEGEAMQSVGKGEQEMRGAA